MVERTGVVSFGGKPVTLIGPEIKVGDTAPDFTALGTDLKPVSLKDFAGKPLILASVPSLDTGVCDAETRRFNEEATGLPGVTILTISMDLPFAQKRWCGAAGVERVITLSDHRDASFGQAYGVLVKELRLLARAVFVVDASGKVTYVEYVPDAHNHPNYEAAIAAARQAAARVS
ncbi:thiol peroxidase [Caldinitratiruptor microaerophilus]|uniref:Thiol peroxidase n=1 Tax=Caldinitratiruptor microaerophilus TaxID=671077 RepID=A0AA35CMC5_9FIRM|nr:thiol peroxidase [Caldinitratiruptor microaerophilus]BDG61028.1 putative thiol peroxidase [Caldinitratiruptor microaerophilus]